MCYPQQCVYPDLTSLEFALIGDMGGLQAAPYVTPGQTNVAKVLDGLRSSRNFKFVLNLGDNFYFEGVKNATDPRFQV